MPVCQVAVFTLLAEGILQRLGAVAAAIQRCRDRDKFTCPEAVIVSDDRAGRIIAGGNSDLFTGRESKVSHHSAVIGHCVCHSCCQFHGNRFTVCDRPAEYDIDILAVTCVSGRHGGIVGDRTRSVDHIHKLGILIDHHSLRQKIHNDRICEVKRFSRHILHCKTVSDGIAELERHILIGSGLTELDLRCPGAIHYRFRIVPGCQCLRLLFVSSGVTGRIGKHRVRFINDLLNSCHNAVFRFFLFEDSCLHDRISGFEVLSERKAGISLKIRGAVLHAEGFDLLSACAYRFDGNIAFRYIDRILFVFCAVKSNESDSCKNSVILIGVCPLKILVHRSLSDDDLGNVVPLLRESRVRGLRRQSGIVEFKCVERIPVRGVRCKSVSQFSLFDRQAVNMILVHRLCELNRCASFVVDKGYLVLIFVVFFRHGEDFVVNNVGVLFDDTVIIRCDTGAFTVNRVVLHCQIGLAGPDILFVSVGRTDRLPFNILIGRLCILNKRVDLLFRQCLIRAVRNFIDVEFHIGVLYSPAEVFLFHDQFEERNIVAGIGVGLIVVKTASEHIERASVGRHVGRKRRIALIDSVKSDITCYVIGLGDRVIISLEDHEFRLALLICGLSGMPGIPVFTVRSFVVHLEPGALKLREHRGFRKTAVFEDLDLNSLVVRQCILVVRRSGTVKLIREVLSGFKALHLNRGIFFIDGVFLSLDLRRFHLVDKVGLAAFAFERNDRSIGAVPVINYFRFGNDCLSVFLQHLERSACELFSGCAVILEDRDAPLKKNIGDCNRYICICLGNHYFILAFFRRARPAVNFHLFDEIAFCLILLQIISPILRKVREHSLGLFDRAVALHSSGGLVLAGLGGNFIAFVILQGEGEAVISCRNTAKIHLFVNDHPDLGKILELQFSCRGFGSVYRIVIRLSRLLDLKLQSAGHHDHLSDRVEFIMSGCFGLYRIVDTGLQTALCDRAVISRCRQSVNFGPGIVVFRECRNRIRFFTCCVECGRIKCMVIKGKLCACQIFDRVLLQIRLDQLQVHIPDVRNSKSKALLVVLILDDLLMQFGTVDTALSARFRCRRIAERIPGAVDQCRVIRILLLEQIDKILIRESVRRTRLSKYERGVRRQHREPGCAAAGRCRLIISCSALRLERECCCCRNSIPVSVFLFDRHFRSGRAVGREDLRLIGHDHREVESKAFVGIEILVTGCCRRHDSSVLARLKPFFEGKAVSVRLEALRAVDLLVCCRAPVLPFPGALVIPLKGETDLLGDEQ